jgi:hypothetical protein
LTRSDERFESILRCSLANVPEVRTVGRSLTARLADESNVQSQKSLLLALWYTVTPVGEAAIRSFADSQKHQPEATTYAKALLGRGSLNGSADQSLREQRRKVMHRPISDEALIEFDQLTSKLIAK